MSICNIHISVDWNQYFPTALGVAVSGMTVWATAEFLVAVLWFCLTVDRCVSQMRVWGVYLVGCVGFVAVAYLAVVHRS